MWSSSSLRTLAALTRSPPGTVNSGKFTVAYDDTANTMTIRMTDTGLSEINEAATVYTDSVKRGYSDCTMRITYAATLTCRCQDG